MKRIELLKRTGICFTAVALSTMIGMANPTLVPVLAGENTEESDGSQDDDGGDGGSSNDGGGEENSGGSGGGSENSGGSSEGSGGDDSGGSDQSSSGGGSSEGSGGGSGSSGESGSGSGSSEESGGGSGSSGESGSGSGSSEESGSGSGDSGSSSQSSGGGTSQSSGGSSENSGNNASQNAGGGTSSDNSGTGTGGTQSVETVDPSQNNSGQGTTAGGQAAPGAATTGAASSQASSTSAKAKDTASEAKKKAVTLNPDETPGSYNQTLMYNGTNTQLIANQNIVSGLSIIRNDFRFVTVDKEPAIAADRHGVYEEMDELSREIGMLSKGDVVYILSEEEDGWLYIESGNVRGFIKKKNVKPADSIPGNEIISFAEEKIPASENDAYAYKHCTTKSTVIDKDYAVADVDTAILEGTEGDSREVGHLASGSLCYVIMQADQKWAYVESGNVRGFAPVKNLTTGSKAKDIVKEKGEESMTKAEELISPSDNKAVYYTLNSVHDGVEYNSIRSDLVETAAKCIGNPYVWGGTSLTNGADCSGFVQTLYSLFGYHMPRVADAQSQYGTQIPISDAAPGDLIFFASNGYVYHVAMYAGDGMTIEAYSDDRGIIATSIGNRDAVWATRVIED